MYVGGSLFYDHASCLIYVVFMNHLDTHELMIAKEEVDVFPQQYISDNGKPWTSEKFWAGIMNVSLCQWLVWSCSILWSIGLTQLTHVLGLWQYNNVMMCICIHNSLIVQLVFMSLWLLYAHCIRNFRTILGYRQNMLEIDVIMIPLHVIQSAISFSFEFLWIVWYVWVTIFNYEYIVVI